MKIRVRAITELEVFESDFPDDWTKEQILACELKRASETISIYDAEYSVELVEESGSDEEGEELANNSDCGKLPW